MSAHGATDHRVEAIDPEEVEQRELDGDLVPDGHRREPRPIRDPVSCIGGRSGCPLAAAEHVGRENEEPICVDAPARPDQGLPPPWREVTWTSLSGSVGITGQSVQDEHHI